MLDKTLQSISEILLKAVRQGVTPNKLAMTCAFGVVISIFPLYGTTTFLCFVVAIAFRLNVVIIQAVNYLFTPVQVALLFPFFRAGIFMLQLPLKVMNKEELLQRINNDWILLMQELGMVAVGGFVAWIIIAVPLFFILNLALKVFFIRWMKVH